MYDDRSGGGLYDDFGPVKYTKPAKDGAVRSPSTFPSCLPLRVDSLAALTSAKSLSTFLVVSLVYMFFYDSYDSLRLYNRYVFLHDDL